MATDVALSPQAHRTLGRVRGIDLARGLAIFGMVAVHIGPTDQPGVFGRLYALPSGRASLLFVLVAGIGISLLSRSRSTSLYEARWTLVWRAALLLPMGLVLQELDHDVNVILQSYAVLFLVAALALRLPSRRLLIGAGLITAIGPAILLFFRSRAPAAFERTGIALTDPPEEIVLELLVAGPYPLITWIAPFLVGIWLGRIDLRSRSVRVRLIVVGAIVAAAAVIAARIFDAVLGGPAEAGDLRHLLSDAAHSQMPLWLIGGTAAAIMVLGLSLLLADAVPRLTWPLQAAGQLALTAYVGHLLALHIADGRLSSASLPEASILLFGFVIVIVLVATLWRSAFDQGPLERLLRAASPKPFRLR